MGAAARRMTPRQRRPIWANHKWFDTIHDFVDEEFDEIFNSHPPTSEGLDYLHNFGDHPHAPRTD